MDKTESCGKPLPTLTLGNSSLQAPVINNSVSSTGRSPVTVEIRRKGRAKKLDCRGVLHVPDRTLDKVSKDGSLTLLEQESRINALNNAFSLRTNPSDVVNESEMQKLADSNEAHDNQPSSSDHDSDQQNQISFQQQSSEKDENRDVNIGSVGLSELSNLSIDQTVNKEIDLKGISSSEAKKNKKHEKIVKEDERSVKKSVSPSLQPRDSHQKHVKLAVDKALSSSDEESDEIDIFDKNRPSSAKKSRYLKKSKVKSKKTKLLRKVSIPEKITVQELAARMSEKVRDLTDVLGRLGQYCRAEDYIDSDTSIDLVEHFGHSAKLEINSSAILENNDIGTPMLHRPPVVTVMGHVDHGKTSLLDAIRKADIAGLELGGITQHIGAYQVTSNGKKITFIDTPGHEAFTAMRARGTNITDIVILVVAVDDGIMAQTIEAINHIKAAGVPVIVAVNKMDKPKSDITKVRDNLLQHGLIAEELGGDVIMIPVSAKERMNLDKLEDAILLVAECLDLRAPVECRASGVVIESKINKGRGVLATIIVQKGALKVGDIVVAGKSSYGRVRAMSSDNGAKETVALPSMPVEILGLSTIPMSGDNFVVVDSEKQARELLSYRSQIDVVSKNEMGKQNFKDHFLNPLRHRTELNVILKSDVVGSLEAIYDSIIKFDHEDLQLRVLHKAAGNITDSDVLLAEASGAVILAFNVGVDSKIRDLAKQKNVDIRSYSIIYELIDGVKSLLNGLLKPLTREVHIGTALVKEVFTSTKLGTIAGCQVSFGVIKRGAFLKLFRGETVIHEGKLKTLRRFKEDIKEVKSGFECGVMIESQRDVQPGDIIKMFDLVEEERSI